MKSSLDKPFLDEPFSLSFEIEPFFGGQLVSGAPAWDSIIEPEHDDDINSKIESISFEYRGSTTNKQADREVVSRETPVGEKNSYTVEWLNKQLAEFVNNYSKNDGHPFYLTQEQLCETILSWLQSEKSDQELGTELFNIMGDAYFSLIQDILVHRKTIAKNYHHLCKQDAVKEAVKSQSSLWDKKPIFAQTVVVQTEEEKHLKKELRKADKKIKRELNKEVDWKNGTCNLIDIERMKEEREMRLLRAMYAPLFKESATYDTVDPEEYPYVFDSFVQAKSSSGFAYGAKMSLPNGCSRNDQRKWEEITIPAAQPPPPSLISKFKIVDVDEDLDEFGKIAFKGFKKLNTIQSIVYKTAYFTNENMLICAPTGAGKTNVAMLAILHQIRSCATGVHNIQLDAFKIVYIAPMKALAGEMTENFSIRLKSLGITVRELTGDMQLTKNEIMQTQIIVTTPEKWDVVTRKAKGDVQLLQLVKLLIIDEVHLLQSDRGPVLEALVARTIRYVESSQSMIRLVGLSATLPNYKDVAEFLHVNKEGLFVFDNRFRPVPLTQTFIGCKATQTMQQMHDMDEVTYDKVYEMVSKGHQVMVFVHARNSTLRTANNLRERSVKNGHSRVFECQTDKLHDSVRMMRKARNKHLQELFEHGFSIHHAGMLRQDRNLVEKLFRAGVVRVLVCTATLAWGVNLPAHSVIIRGTEMYDSAHGTYVDIGILDVMQIFGRAGRPQYDTEGHGVIITAHEKLRYYLSLLTNQFPIESNFLNYITDNMNAEIVSGTISTIQEAVEWLGYTYLYIRMRKNPINYGIEWEAYRTDSELLQRREQLSRQSAEALDKAKMIRYNERTGSLDPIDLGRTASHYYIKYDTIEKFNELLVDNMELHQIIAMIAQAQEFDQLKSRDDEYEELNYLLRNSCKLKVSLGIEDRLGKVNVLMQSTLSKAFIESFSLVSDKLFIVQNVPRISRGLFEYVLKKGNAVLASNLLKLSLMFEREMWCFPYDTPFSQFYRDIPFEIMNKIKDANLDIDRILSGELTGDEIGRIIRFNRWGHAIERLARVLPRLEIKATVKPITRTVLQICLEIIPNFIWDDKYHGRISESFWIWIIDSEEGSHIYHSELFKVIKKQVIKKEAQKLIFNIPLLDPENRPSQYIVYAYSDRWLGCESETEISCNKLILPEKGIPQTKLLDLDPLPITALNNSLFESLYKFKFFNPIQTQIFHTLYHTDLNVLLGAPTGSGKTIAAEIAMMRLFKLYPNAKTVYIAPLKALVRERVEDWKRKIQANLGKSVVELTGDVTPDRNAIERSDIIVTTPEKWDGISRSWQTRRFVQDVGLIVIDEIHLLGEDRGPVLEVIVSRTNFITETTKRRLRLIGLSTAIANSQDLASWMNIKKVGLYNFKPSVRPVPIEVHVQGFPGKNYCPRMALMNKPTFRAIQQHSPDKPVLVFVSSRRQTRLTALDLIAFLASSDNQSQWLRMPEDEINALISNVRDGNLRLTLAFGVGLHHAGLHEKDRNLVEELFTNQMIQVLITTATLAWGVNLPAHAVIIKGTEYYDGKTNRYVDFPITDVLQMMGRAGRPQFDTSGVAVILVQDVKKEYYKKFLYEAFPVESSLLSVLPDHLNAEIVAGTLKTKQDCIEYMNWTYLFRRIIKNPAYYGLEDNDEVDVNRFLSQKIDECLQKLIDNYCITIDDDDRTIFATELGRICSYYYLHHTTVRLFEDRLCDNNDLSSLIQIICDAHEYSELPVRHNEDILNAQLAQSCQIKLDNRTSFESSHTKANLLLQAHFQRLPLPCTDYLTDLKSVLDQAIRLMQAMIDISASAGHLATTLRIVNLQQMIIQAGWVQKNSLLVIPGVNEDNLYLLLEIASSLPELIKVFLEKGFVDISKIPSKEFREQEMSNYLSELPFIDLKIEISSEKDGSLAVPFNTPDIPVNQRQWTSVQPNTDYEVTCFFLRAGLKFRNTSKAVAPRFPKHKDEGWFIVLGKSDADELLALKRVGWIRFQKHWVNQKLVFTTPSTPGRVLYTLYFLSDSYIGLDQQFDIYLDVKSE